METATERRAAGARRVALDGMVELEHDDFHLCFEADAVNLGPGGASMRAAYLPEIGSHLSWRYVPPGGSELLEADSEVVWARSMDADTSEFGIRS